MIQHVISAAAFVITAIVTDIVQPFFTNLSVKFAIVTDYL